MAVTCVSVATIAQCELLAFSTLLFLLCGVIFSALVLLRSSSSSSWEWWGPTYVSWMSEFMLRMRNNPFPVSQQKLLVSHYECNAHQTHPVCGVEQFSAEMLSTIIHCIFLYIIHCAITIFPHICRRFTERCSWYLSFSYA